MPSSSLPRKSLKVGIAEMPSCFATSAASSTFTWNGRGRECPVAEGLSGGAWYLAFAKVTSGYSSLILAKTGAAALQGGHHVA